MNTLHKSKSHQEGIVMLGNGIQGVGQKGLNAVYPQGCQTKPSAAVYRPGVRTPGKLAWLTQGTELCPYSCRDMRVSFSLLYLHKKSYIRTSVGIFLSVSVLLTMTTAIQSNSSETDVYVKQVH